MIGVVETPLGFICDVAGDVADVVALARERGLQMSVVTGPWRDGARDRRRVRARRAPAPGHRDHRAAGSALGLFSLAADDTLAWSPAGRLALDEARALVTDEARALGYGHDEVLAPAPSTRSWLLDETNEVDALTVPCAPEHVAREVARAVELATRLARALGLGEARPRPGALDVRADDRLGRSWTIARLRYEPSALRGALVAPTRAVALALEHLDGALPTWLAPEQVRVLPVGGDAAPGRALAAALTQAGARVRVDADGPLGNRVGAATAARVPYLAFVGPDEAAAGTVRVRARGGAASALTSWSGLAEHVTDERHLRSPWPVLPWCGPPSQASARCFVRHGVSPLRLPGDEAAGLPLAAAAHRATRSPVSGAAAGGPGLFQRVKKERLPSANR